MNLICGKNRNSICDERYFSIKNVDEVIIGDIIIVKNNVGIIIEIYKSECEERKISHAYVKCVGIFDNNKYEEIYNLDTYVLIPKIHKYTYKYIDIVEECFDANKFITFVRLFDKDNDKIIKVKVSDEIGFNILKNLKSREFCDETSIGVKVIKFKNLIKIIGDE